MKILLAVSGGIDSMYLANLAGVFFPQAGFAVAHCNFRLRGDESDGDERFVKEWCASHGLECFVKRFDTGLYASGKGVSAEMAARELRYAWFALLCEREGFDGIAVAHNANDNAETIFLNILRGTGSKGLRGMAAESWMKTDGAAAALRIFRPMLNIGRDEIRAWMKQHGCDWREDSTNVLSDFKRNKLRNKVFPVFREINPSFIQTISADIKRFTQTDDIAEDYFRQACESAVDKNGDISIPELVKLKHWQFVLWRLLEPFGLSGQTFSKLTALLEKYRTEPSGTVTVSGKVFESPNYIIKASRKILSIRERTS